MNDHQGHRPGPRRSKQQIAGVLRKAGYPDAAEEALQSLPETVDVEEIEKFCREQGLSRDDLMSRLGGSP